MLRTARKVVIQKHVSLVISGFTLLVTAAIVWLVANLVDRELQRVVGRYIALLVIQKVHAPDGGVVG